jgi:hypothetical protein
MWTGTRRCFARRWGNWQGRGCSGRECEKQTTGAKARSDFAGSRGPEGAALPRSKHGRCANPQGSATGLLVCVLPHETLYAEVFIDFGRAADVHGVRDGWAAAAPVAGLAEAAFGFAGCAQGGSRYSHLDCSECYHRSANNSKCGSNQDLPCTRKGVDAVWYSRRRNGGAAELPCGSVFQTENFDIVCRLVP